MPKRGGPEDLVQTTIVKMLRYKGWFVRATHGNMYQSGFPDLFACHVRYGQRWIEVKDPNRGGDVFTNAQHEVFPLLCANGSGVWVLIGSSDSEYNKLFNRPNWSSYLDIWKPKGLSG